jgi:hypothetical protein
MRYRGVLILSVLLFVAFSGVQSSFAQGGTNLVVLANDANYQAAAFWVRFLEEKGVQVNHLTPKEAAKVKSEKYVVIMGGPKDTDEIGKLVAEALGPQDSKAVDEGPKMVMKSDTWTKGQNVIVFAGKDQQAVETARKSNRDGWWPKIASWFDVEIETQKKGGY